ncbi:Type IV secretion system protein virB4 [compost metagenome]
MAELSLHGFDDELAILSGRTANVELADSIRAEVGDRLDDWLPVFQQRRSAS